jgi:hypothetical protein
LISPDLLTEDHEIPLFPTQPVSLENRIRRMNKYANSSNEKKNEKNIDF